MAHSYIMSVLFVFLFVLSRWSMVSGEVTVTATKTELTIGGLAKIIGLWNAKEGKAIIGDDGILTRRAPPPATATGKTTYRDALYFFLDGPGGPLFPCFYMSFKKDGIFFHNSKKGLFPLLSSELIAKIKEGQVGVHLGDRTKPGAPLRPKSPMGSAASEPDTPMDSAASGSGSGSAAHALHGDILYDDVAEHSSLNGYGHETYDGFKSDAAIMILLIFLFSAICAIVGCVCVCGGFGVGFVIHNQIATKQQKKFFNEHPIEV